MTVVLHPLSPGTAITTTALGHVRSDYVFVDADGDWPLASQPGLMAALAERRAQVASGFDRRPQV